MQARKNPILIVLALIAVLLAGGLFILLQDANPSDESGTLSGNVVDGSSGIPLKGVTVTAVDEDGVRYTSHENSDTTGSDGFFSLSLPPNDYTLLFEADGYQTFESTASYTIENGKNKELAESFRLTAAAQDSSSEPAAQDSLSEPYAQESPSEPAARESPSEPAARDSSPEPQVSAVNYTIYCVNEYGQTIREYTEKGNVGSQVVVYAPEIADYTPQATEQTITLSANAAGNTVTFYYDYNQPASSISNNVNNHNIPDDAFVYNGHSYYAHRTGGITSFWDAEDYCESLGGHLAIITDDDLNSALYEYVFEILGYESAYFGLTDDGSEGDWYWVDGTDYSYRSWAAGQPDNNNGHEDYALFYYKDKAYTWNDGDFGPDRFGTVTFLIEWDTAEY